MTRQRKHKRNFPIRKDGTRRLGTFNAGSQIRSNIFVHSTPRVLLRRQNPRPIAPEPEPFYQRIEQPIIEHSLNVLELTIPQIAPFIETGKFLYTHKEEVAQVVNTFFSDETLDSKLDVLSRIVTDMVKTEATNRIASFSANSLTDMIDNSGGFEMLNKNLNLNLGYDEKPRFKGFFKSSIEDLMNDT